MARSAPCAALRFFDSFLVRRRMRRGMPGFPDSAVFFRHWDLFDTTREPECVALVTEEEKGAVADFRAAFDRLEWRAITGADHIKQTDEREFRKLKRPALRLLTLLKRNRANQLAEATPVKPAENREP